MSAGTRRQRRRRRAGQPPSARDAAVHGARTTSARCHWWLSEYRNMVRLHRWLVVVTPRILSEFSREMPGSDGGGVADVLRLEFQKTISFVFDTFSFRLFAAAQAAILSISSVRVPTLAVLVLLLLLWFYVICWILSACQSYFTG